MSQTLNVCWSVPDIEATDGESFLSFLRPSIEEEYIKRFNNNVISGRAVAQEVKDTALNIYVDIVAKIGSGKASKGQSLRKSLKNKNGNSLWWYHPVSFKSCETDNTFNRLIQIVVIDRILSEKKFDKVVFWGADDAIANVLKTKYRITCRKNKKRSIYLQCVRAVGSRLNQFIENTYHWYLIKRDAPEVSCLPDVVLEGFWDWSVRANDIEGKMDDRYFKSLPDVLDKRGVAASWILWFSPHAETEPKYRSSRKVMRGAKTSDRVIFLQKYLNMKDIIKAFCDCRPLFKYLSFAVSDAFKRLFKSNGLNLFPLFEDRLLYYFLSSPIPQHALIEKACSNVFDRYKPKVVLTFLEMFPYSRALYAGAKLGNANTVLATMQHASYSREKTFVRLDPEIEFNGKPDNCAVPAPDYVFAMGNLGKEIFKECGFKPQNIFLTGSTRYESVRNEPERKHGVKKNTQYSVLMVATLDRDIEMDMIEAVYHAAKDLSDIDLLLRNHPFSRTDEHPLYESMKERIEITHGTLDEDLERADLILFSYSTVAEEALVRGVPVWQWCSAAFNGSVFRDIKVVPRFSTVKDLRDSFVKFIDDPALFVPDRNVCKKVFTECFFSADGKASDRIADKIIELSCLN